MKVMTLNIWNYSPPWYERRALIVERIEADQPDVVFLQETRHDFRFLRGEGQGEQLAALTGYHATSAVAQVYVPFPRVDEGLTVLTREEPTTVYTARLRRFPRERQDENQRICLGMTIRIRDEEADLYNTHFSLSPVARVANAADVLRFVDRHSGRRPAILAGDLNAEPGSEPLLTLTGSGTSAGMTGFVDVWRSVHPDEPGFTYSSDGPVRRIDYLLVRNVAGIIRADLIGGLASGRGVYPSDHLGIVAEIALTSSSADLLS